MKAVPVAICLPVIAGLLVACRPSPELPITGEIKLEFIRKDAHDIHFRLKNQTVTSVSFWGARDWWWQGVFPQGPTFECVLADPDQMHESPYPLIDGPAWERFVIEPSDEIEIVVGKSFLEGSDGKLPTGRCRFVLDLGGNAVVKSEEFESMASASL